MPGAARATRADHADPRLRPRATAAAPALAVAAAARAAQRVPLLELAEADPRRGHVEAWVRVLPGPAGLPRAAGYGGRGWFHRLRGRPRAGWLQVAVDAGAEGGARVGAEVRVGLPLLGGLLAAWVLGAYLRRLDAELAALAAAGPAPAAPGAPPEAPRPNV